jgi:hypothetical protein
MGWKYGNDLVGGRWDLWGGIEMVYVGEGGWENEMRFGRDPEPVRQPDHEPPPGAPDRGLVGPQPACRSGRCE